jgi:hypothetical protein
MDPRTRNGFVLGILLVVGITAGAALTMGRGSVTEPKASPDAQQVVGVVVRVESTGLTNVRGFTLRTDAGAEMTFALDALENGAEFPPGHLVEHQASSSPIRVWFKTEGGVNDAIRLEDAAPPG